MNKYKHILLAEDDEDDIYFFTETLTEIDPQAKCTIAKNGQAAWELLLQNPNLYHIVFLDLNMPLVSGLEFLERRQTESSLADIPVVVLTTSQASAEQCYQLGASAFIAKPLTTKAYEEILSTILNMNVARDGTLVNDGPENMAG